MGNLFKLTAYQVLQDNIENDNNMGLNFCLQRIQRSSN
jgi:hypothetical protein